MVQKTIKILVVDDFPTMRRIVKNLLKDLGFENVDEAEDVAGSREAAQWQFRLCGIRLEYAQHGWLEMLKHIRADPALKGAASADGHRRGQEENIIAAAQAGANGYVVKPFTAATLEEKLNKIFEKLGG